MANQERYKVKFNSSSKVVIIETDRPLPVQSVFTIGHTVKCVIMSCYPVHGDYTWTYRSEAKLVDKD